MHMFNRELCIKSDIMRVWKFQLHSQKSGENFRMI